MKRKRNLEKNDNKMQLHLLDDFIIKSVIQQIDFNDVDYMYEMENALENDLKRIFQEWISDIEEMEAILLFTQARKQYAFFIKKL